MERHEEGGRGLGGRVRRLGFRFDLSIKVKRFRGGLVLELIDLYITQL